MIAQAAAAPPVTTRRSPYQGLVPYTDADAEWFFGRDEWQEIVRASLRSYRITVLYGASGVGKTSLLRAGLMRRLEDEAHGRDGGPRVLPVYFSAWSLDRPLAAVEHAVSDAAAKSGSAPTDGNAGPTLADALAAWSRRMEGALLVVLDQLEELFVYHDRPDDPILKELAAALSSRDPAIHFLLSIREDALAMLDRFKGHVPGLLDHLLRIEHLDRAAGREAIVAPLERWNEVLAAPGQPIEIEEALVESVLDQVEAGKVSLGEGGTGAVVGDSHPVGVEAPYLQLVLERIWDEERSHESETLRQQTFDRLGGATAVVRTHLDAALAALPSSEQDVAGATFRHLVTPSGNEDCAPDRRPRRVRGPRTGTGEAVGRSTRPRRPHSPLRRRRPLRDLPRRPRPTDPRLERPVGGAREAASRATAHPHPRLHSGSAHHRRGGCRSPGHLGPGTTRRGEETTRHRTLGLAGGRCGESDGVKT